MVRNRTIDLKHGQHNWEKQNLMTLSNKTGMYDIQKCSHCGITGKTYTLTTITLDKKYTKEKIDNCSGFTLKIPKQIKITNCTAQGSHFSNLIPNSVHNVIDAPKPYKNDAQGVWVMGVGEPVKVLNNEFTVIETNQNVKWEKHLDKAKEISNKSKRKVGDTKIGKDNIKRVWSKTPSGFDWRRVKTK